MKRKLLPLLVIPSLIATSFIGCVELPSDTIAPSWDVPISFPITDTTFVLDDMIGDDSTIVASDDPASLGLLYFQQENIIDPIFVDSNLTLDGFSMSAAQAIGEIAIDEVDPITTSILISDWTDFSPGDTVVFPESESDLEIPFPKIDAFSYVILDEGDLEIEVFNRLPIELELRGIKIVNIIGKSVVAERTETFIIPIESSILIQFELDGVTIEDSLLYVGTIFSTGSSGSPIAIPVEAGTELVGSFSNLVISEVKAVLPEQEPFETDDIVVFDDSTMLETAVFYNGNFSIEFNNNLDVDINLELKIDNLKMANGSVYTENISLSRNESNKIISYSNLEGWEIVTLTPGIPSNELSYSAVINTVVSNDPSTLSKNDSVNIDISFGDVTFDYIEGIITPVYFDIAETDFDFDIGDVDDKFSYDELTWGSPEIILSLNSSANMKMGLNAIISGSNSSTTNSMDVSINLNGGGETDVVYLSNFGFAEFMNSFSDAIPNSFSFSGTAIVNPNYEIGSVERTDSVTGKINIEIPLDLGIAGGTFIDTMYIDSIDVDPESINSLSLTIEMTNAIPVGLSISGAVLDELGNELFPFPPSYNENSAIIFQPPTVDENGYVSSASNFIQTIELRSEEAKLFFENPTLYLDVKLDTPSQNPVKFRNTDSIRMKVYGEVNLQVK